MLEYITIKEDLSDEKKTKHTTTASKVETRHEQPRKVCSESEMIRDREEKKNNDSFVKCAYYMNTIHNQLS